jgi:hypothetical protein
MRRQITRSFAPGLVAAALFTWGCDRARTPASLEKSRPLFWFGCSASQKFTGGGRIDDPNPQVGKTTFGFNVHAQDFCSSDGEIKGQLQVVSHPSRTLVHSTSIRTFASYANPDFPGGQCAEFSGTARVKGGNGSWDYNHTFAVKTCDNGEPGSSPGRGPDTFGVSVSGVGNTTGDQPLTGGNIQAHKTH